MRENATQRDNHAGGGKGMNHSMGQQRVWGARTGTLQGEGRTGTPNTVTVRKTGSMRRG